MRDEIGIVRLRIVAFAFIGEMYKDVKNQNFGFLHLFHIEKKDL